MTAARGPQDGGAIRSVLVIDDHPLYSDALSMALAHVFPNCAPRTVTTLQAGLDAAAARAPDLILLDLRLPDVTGISGFRALRAAMPEVPVVVISALTSDEVVGALMRAGAAGFIHKDVSASTLHEALQMVGAGRRYLSPGLARAPDAGTADLQQGRPQSQPTARQVRQRLANLTPQQTRIMKLICAGKPNKQIAWELSLAEATVKAHITALLRRLGVRNRTQAAVLAESMNATAAPGISDADARLFLSQ